MDLTTIIILAATGLAMICGTLYMLHRSWGDFPTPIQLPTPLEPPASRSSDSRSDSPSEPDENAADDAPIADGAPVVAGPLVLIEHPLIKQAALRDLAEKGPTAEYIVQDGDTLYLALDKISDPQQRYAAAKVMQVIHQGGVLSIYDTLKLLGQARKDR